MNMKTTNELKSIIKKWWDYNQTVAQVGEARYFVEQIGDWESNFTNFQTEGYQTPETDFQLDRVKDVKGGISLKVSSGPNTIDGILIMSTGELVLKDSPTNTTGSGVFQTATMD